MRRFLYKIFQDEKSKEYIIFHDIIAVLILVSIVIVIFESVKPIERAHPSFFYYAEVIFLLVFSAEYIFRIVSARRKSAYVFSFFGLIDFVAILPSIIYFFLPIVSGSLLALRTLRILRILRLLRLIRLIRFIGITKEKRKQLETTIKTPKIFEIEIYAFSVVAVMTIAGSLVYLFESRLPDTIFINIPISMWWAATTMTTTGYGDLVPITVGGKIVAVFTMFAGLALIAILISIVGKAMQKLLFGSEVKE